MTSLHFETTVPLDGRITLPMEYCGKEVSVQVVPDATFAKKRASLPKNNDENEFYRKKSLEEINAEQDGPKICTDPDKYFGYLSDVWDSPEEMEEFLRRRKEEI